MSKPAVEIVTLGEQAIWGIGRQSGDQTISADIHALSAAYHSQTSVSRGSVLPFFVLSRNYDGRNGSFELFVGGALEKDGLEQAFLPPGEYAGMTVRPRLGFLWGAAIGAAKRYFYQKWLPQSPYGALNMEYELHTEKSIRSHPSMDLFFAVKRKE